MNACTPGEPSPAGPREVRRPLLPGQPAPTAAEGSALKDAAGEAGACGDGKCDGVTEHCDDCPKDCGACDGCKARGKAGCPSCACEVCVCKIDGYCCAVQWDSVCAALCSSSCSGCGLLDGGPAKLDTFPPDLPADQGSPWGCGDAVCTPDKEFCDTCSKDCGTCDGCKPQEFAKCPGCACEACVCALDAYCCGTQWDAVCAGLCKSSCGGCGLVDLGPPPDGPKIPPPDVKGPTCGDGKCDPIGEFCDTCSKDCGTCDGCEVQSGKACPGCACEQCVCKLDLYCCNSQWDSYCVQMCGFSCGGCKAKDGGLDALASLESCNPPPPDLKPPDLKPPDVTPPDLKADGPPKDAPVPDGDGPAADAKRPEAAPPDRTPPDHGADRQDVLGRDRAADRAPPDAPPGADAGPGPDGDGCGCAAPASSPAGSPAGLALLALLFASRRRQRR